MEVAHRLLDSAEERLGRMDVLVANAGLYVGGDLWESDEDATCGARRPREQPI